MQSDFSLHTMVSFCDFWAIFWMVVGRGMSMGQFWVFALFEFLHFWCFWAVFWHVLGFSVHLGIWGFLVSCEVTRGTILVVGTVHDGFWGVLGVQGGSGGVQTGSPLPLYGTFCPSGSHVWHQIWFQTLQNGPTGQCLLGWYHWPISDLLEPFWGLPKGHSMSKWCPFVTLKSPKNPYMESKMQFTYHDH